MDVPNEEKVSTVLFLAEEVRRAAERRAQDVSVAAGDFSERPKGGNELREAVQFLSAIKQADIRYENRINSITLSLIEKISGKTMNELAEAFGDGGPEFNLMAALGIDPDNGEFKIEAAVMGEDGEPQEVDLCNVETPDKPAGEADIPGIDLTATAEEPQPLEADFGVGDLVHKVMDEDYGGMVIGIIDPQTVSVRIFGDNPPSEPQEIPVSELAEGYKGEVG